MNYKIAVIPGDGIGPEVTAEAIKALDAVGEKFGHKFEYTYLLAGGAAIDKTGRCLPEETVEKAKNSDAVLLGAVGGPKWDSLPGDERPEKALLGLRKALGLYANLRPAIMFDELKSACPLKDEKVIGGLDLLVVRELTGGIYFGERGTVDTDNMGKAAYDVEMYSEKEVERVARTAFEMAMKRNKKVTSVDKANVLESSRLWRKTVAKVAADYPEVELDNFYVDNASMQLVYNQIVLDEFQDYPIHDSVLEEFLRKGRKFHIELILSTQYISDLRKPDKNALMQQSTMYIFQPVEEDTKTVAETLEMKSQNKISSKTWREVLYALQR